MKLVQASRTLGSLGEPLPDIYPSLRAAGIRFFRGDLVSITAAPGVGKTALSLDMTLRSEFPIAYFSLDTPKGKMVKRVKQNVLGLTADQVEQREERGEDFSYSLKNNDNVEWFFLEGPELKDIGMCLLSFAEMWGCWPHQIILDNAMNLVRDWNDPWSELRDVYSNLDVFAKKTQANVVILNHVTDGQNNYVDGYRAPTLSATKGKTVELQSLALSLSRSEIQDDLLYISVLKNRDGRASSGGGIKTQLNMDLSKMRLWDPRAGGPDVR